MKAQEIIARLKAEVERQARSIDTATGDYAEGRRMEQRIILSVLSDLEKEEKPTNIDFEQELYKHFGQVKDFTLGMQIGKYFYELGCRCTAEKYDEIEYKRQRADVCDGEEEEEYEQIKQKVCSDCPSHKDDDCGYVKRQLQRKCNYLSDVMYGYELGRQSKPKVSEDVEEEYKDYVESDPVYSKLVNRNAGLSIARHFAQWHREQMMKEAVDGWVAVDSDTGGNRRVTFFPKEPVRDLLTEYKYWAATRPNYESVRLNPNAFPNLKWEDEPKKVKLIIVKED